MSRAGSKALIREINEALVLDAVRSRGTVSRTEISASTGLSAATVTGITAKLVNDGLLAETDGPRGSVGRPARLLELGGGAVIAVGVRLSATDMDVVLVNPRGDVVASRRENLSSTDPEHAAAAIAQVVRSAAADYPSAPLQGIGVAISGVVDHARGVVLHSGSLGWENVPFASMLAEATDETVLVDNYVNAFAMGLLMFDTGLAGRDLLVFSAGVSLGASVVMQGRIHRGFSGYAGGFAHTRSAIGQAPDRPCHCGDTGCLETWGSLWGIQRELERLALPIDDLTSDVATAVVRDAGEHLGVAMANACKMFGPEKVILAFAPELRQPELAAACEDAFRRQYMHGTTPQPEWEPVVASGGTFARGAAYAVVRRLFTVDVDEPTERDRLTA